MARKFFNKRVYSRKQEKIKAALIVAGAGAGVLFCLFLIAFFTNKNSKTVIKINELIQHEVNSLEPEEHLFFKELKGIPTNEVKLNLKEVDFSKLGTYNVEILIKNKKYKSKIEIIDVTPPELVLKELKIKNGENYNLNDFIESCSDNSKEDCNMIFYDISYGLNEVKEDYSNYTKEGSYEIKIMAEDSSKNQTIKSTKLFIGEKETVYTCEYGNTEFNKDVNLTQMLGSNNCAINPDLFEHNTIRKAILQTANTETQKLKLEINKLPNLKDNITINRLTNPVMNNDGKGLVGYSLFIEATDKTEKVIVSYYLNAQNKRVYIENPYNLK